MTEIEQECIRRIAEIKGLPVGELRLDTSLETLAVDSLDLVSLSFDLEEQYAIQIPESRLHSLRTIGDVADAVQQAIAAPARSISSAPPAKNGDTAGAV